MSFEPRDYLRHILVAAISSSDPSDFPELQIQIKAILDGEE